MLCGSDRNSCKPSRTIAGGLFYLLPIRAGMLDSLQPKQQTSAVITSAYYTPNSQGTRNVVMALQNFNPDAFLETWSDARYSPIHNGKTFAQCIRAAFDIPETDKYIYRAQAETTLDITQRAIAAKRAHGLHGWYHNEDGKPVSPLSHALISFIIDHVSSIDQLTLHTARSSPSNPRRNYNIYLSLLTLT